MAHLDRINQTVHAVICIYRPTIKLCVICLRLVCLLQLTYKQTRKKKYLRRVKLTRYLIFLITFFQWAIFRNSCIVFIFKIVKLKETTSLEQLC